MIIQSSFSKVKYFFFHLSLSLPNFSLSVSSKIVWKHYCFECFHLLTTTTTTTETPVFKCGCNCGAHFCSKQCFATFLTTKAMKTHTNTCQTVSHARKLLQSSTNNNDKQLLQREIVTLSNRDTKKNSLQDLLLTTLTICELLLPLDRDDDFICLATNLYLAGVFMQQLQQLPSATVLECLKACLKIWRYLENK